MNNDFLCERNKKKQFFSPSGRMHGGLILSENKLSETEGYWFSTFIT